MRRPQCVSQKRRRAARSAARSAARRAPCIPPQTARSPADLRPAPRTAAFNYLSSQGYTFLVVADEAYGRTVPFAFLERARDEWFAKWADKGAAAAAHSLDKSFGARLRHWMDYCEANPEEVSKVAAVQKKVDEVKGIMVENIERVLERGERIELLVDKTDSLRFQADRFHKTGRALRSKMWWQNFKIQLIVLLIVVVIGLVIFASICFGGGGSCI